MIKLSSLSIRTVRHVVQWSFLLWVIGIGIRFGMFVTAIEHGATAPIVSRPAGVEGFLPIGALASLKYWLSTGEIHPVHPAALVIFLAILFMSLLAGKSFCSWLCPVGTMSEEVSGLGAKLFGRNFRVGHWLDVVLRSVKYLLMLLFVKIILLDMPVNALAGFLDDPYWAVSDVKMLHFFTRMSVATMVILAILTALSLVYKNFWCRYLCPYGALLGLVSLASPFRIRRNAAGCSGCKRCTTVCPSALEIHSRATVYSPECTGCLTCVSHCPRKGVLSMQLAFVKRPLPAWVFPAVALLAFMAVIAAGMISGHWHGSLSLADYRQLIPLASYFSH